MKEQARRKLLLNGEMHVLRFSISFSWCLPLMAKYSNFASYFVNGNVYMEWMNLMSLGSVILTELFTTLWAFELIFIKKKKEFIGNLVTLNSDHVFFCWRLIVASTLSEKLNRFTFFLGFFEFSLLRYVLFADLVSSPSFLNSIPLLHLATHTSLYPMLLYICGVNMSRCFSFLEFTCFC